MKTLLIDNGSTLVKKLALLSPGEETVVSYDEIPSDLSDFSLILLSGSSKMPVQGNEDIFAEEIRLIQTTKIPLIGICLGHQLIAHAFGSPLTHLGMQHVGMTEVEVVNDHWMFAGEQSFIVYENHQYGVDVITDELIVLAQTDHAIAALKHKHRPIYGFQFHPENHTDKQFGDEIYLKLFQELTKQQKPSRELKSFWGRFDPDRIHASSNFEIDAQEAAKQVELHFIKPGTPRAMFAQIRKLIDSVRAPS